MALDPREPPAHGFCAGDSVEVVDASSKLDRTPGVVAFFVGDNIYVRFPTLGGRPTKMFFAAQLRPIAAQQQLHVVAKAWRFFHGLGTSFGKIRQ